jgi:hypothetical protein
VFATSLAALLFLAGVDRDSIAPITTDCRTFELRPIARGTRATARAPQVGSRWSLGRQFEHALVIVLENQDYDAVMSHDYFRALARRGTLFTHYNGLFHPSYANYLALVGGKYFGTIKDDQREIPASERTIADLLEARGLTWRQYAEGYPGACYTGSSASGSLYERKHVPFMSFQSITKSRARCDNVVPAREFDRKSLPAFALYSPDMCHDGHDICGTVIAQAKGWIGTIPGAHRAGFANRQLDQSSAWLEAFLEPLLADTQVMKDTLVVVTFDESRDDAHNHIYTVFLGGMVEPGAQVHACYDHYNLLRTIEANFSLGTMGGEDAKSDPIVGGVWRTRPRP